MAQLPSSQLDDIETAHADANGQFAFRIGFINQPAGRAFAQLTVTPPGRSQLASFDTTGFVVTVSRGERRWTQCGSRLC
jgi:hypothetical protein